MNVPLTQEEAENIINQSQTGPQWGYALPLTVQILQHYHAEQTGEPNCTWFPRWDINRWMCQHGIAVLHLPIRVSTGADRN